MIKMTEMTRDEAAKMIKDDIRLHHDDLSGKYRHALNLAIKALEQPEIIHCGNCKYSRFFDPNFYCYEHGSEMIVSENGFCYLAEMREHGRSI